MKIAHINSRLTGGAAIAARRLHDSLVAQGIDSVFLYGKSGPAGRKEKQPPDQSYLNFHKNNSIPAKYFRELAKNLYPFSAQYYLIGRPKGYELFSQPWTFFNTPLEDLPINPDIIHLHWISGMVDYPSLFNSVRDSTPIVWTLHDMNPFTGGCHYSWECKRYLSACCDCPQLSHSSSVDLSTRSFHTKRKSLMNKNIHIVGDSKWLENEARQSIIFSNARSFRTIHYGLDTALFIPGNKTACRKKLGINENLFIIAFGAVDTSARRKGMNILARSLSLLGNTDKITLLYFGRGQIDDIPKNFQSVNIGYVDKPEDLINLYSAADLFVIPSLHEAFGQTSLEAMACGTPVIGTDIGGIPDLVIDRKTGLLFKSGDPKDLAKKITWLINHPEERLKMSSKARRYTEREFTLKKQADGYLDLYREILS